MASEVPGDLAIGVTAMGGWGAMGGKLGRVLAGGSVEMDQGASQQEGPGNLSCTSWRALGTAENIQLSQSCNSWQEGAGWGRAEIHTFSAARKPEAGQPKQHGSIPSKSEVRGTLGDACLVSS